jgi:hypothetical protein
VSVPATESSGAPRPDAVSAIAAGFLDLALAPTLFMAFVLAVAVGWTTGSFAGVFAIVTVYFIERGTESPARPGLVGIATFLYALFALFAIHFGTVLSCRQPTDATWAYVAAGAVLAGLATLSLWKHFLWGVPIAILLALVVFFAVYSRLPAPPFYCGAD